MAAALLAGCSAASAAGPRAVAEQWLSSLRAGDGMAACELLAPETRSKQEQTAGRPCPEAIVDEDLPRGGRVRGAQVWSDAAMVHLDTDTLFLAEFSSGWKVTAAGCRARPGRPYDCTMESG